MSRVAFGAEFTGADGYLDSPTMGLPPGFVTDALYTALRSWQDGTLQAKQFDGPVADARTGFASLVGAEPHRVAMAGSVASGLALVAAAVPDGARVGVLRGEFTSVTFPFAAQAGRAVSLTELAPGVLEDRAGEFDVVAASLVQSADGAVLDVARLRVVAGDAVVVVDVTQALGWCDVDLGWADVVVGASYKWLLAPRGVAWMALSDRIAGTLTPHGASWYAGAAPWPAIYGLPLRVADDARRFDASPAWFSVLGASLSVPWLASLDRAAVHAHAVGLANLVRSATGLPAADSAIVSLNLDTSPEQLRAAGIRASARAGAIRVGFHLYNTENDVDRLLDVVGR